MQATIDKHNLAIHYKKNSQNINFQQRIAFSIAL